MDTSPFLDPDGWQAGPVLRAAAKLHEHGRLDVRTDGFISTQGLESCQHILAVSYLKTSWSVLSSRFALLRSHGPGPGGVGMLFQTDGTSWVSHGRLIALPKGRLPTQDADSFFRQGMALGPAYPVHTVPLNLDHKTIQTVTRLAEPLAVGFLLAHGISRGMAAGTLARPLLTYNGPVWNPKGAGVVAWRFGTKPTWEQGFGKTLCCALEANGIRPYDLASHHNSGKDTIHLSDSKTRMPWLLSSHAKLAAIAAWTEAAERAGVPAVITP